jgi:hypothetical protein
VVAGAKVPAAHSDDGYEETLCGLRGVLTLIVMDRRIDSRRRVTENFFSINRPRPNSPV